MSQNVIWPVSEARAQAGLSVSDSLIALTLRRSDRHAIFVSQLLQEEPERLHLASRREHFSQHNWLGWDSCRCPRSIKTAS